MCTLLKNANFMYETRTTRIHCFRSNQSINNIGDVSVWCGWHRTAYAVYVQRIFSKMALRWRRGDELLNKVVIFIFLAYKKYSRRFIKLRLNHWWQTDYSDNALHTFLSLDSVFTWQSMGQASRFSSKISYILFRRRTKLLWVWNDIRVINDNIFILGWSNSLRKKHDWGHGNLSSASKKVFLFLLY